MTERQTRIPTDIPAVIIAGGLSSRMGQNKSALQLGARPLLDRIIERLRPQACSIDVNTNAVPAPDLPPGVTAFGDTVSGHLGPLAGVLSALRHTERRHPVSSCVTTVPTDTPFFPTDLVARLAAARQQADQIAIAFTDDIMHPIFGLWPVAIADDLERWLITDDKRRVRSFIARHPMVAVHFPMIETKAGAFDPFYNINTPADHAQAERWLALLEAEKP
ncbi:molybdenum cofactor guanylyltransferase MobA [Pararhizobium antarcticum]|uniref:Molybdenum cofactor guanylyltransferase n=1 Tax=Pararhizobium antarcticum TaxID=1798805 RepID=A0A657LNS0_9HYPH|nr:molybdenum cofactor guanylyltransferase MobA [Pararhizobium antarcticum]OJF93452.1 molybdenum cofactor guanylyltransferase [Pararhizobium antarcticum]OJG00445.1 molybdenum cofactor guanylyltransferase [Rhizobium sp. 58]